MKQIMMVEKVIIKGDHLKGERVAQITLSFPGKSKEAEDAITALVRLQGTFAQVEALEVQQKLDL